MHKASSKWVEKRDTKKKNIVQRWSMNKIAVHNNKQQGELEKSVASVGNIKVKMHILYRVCISVAVNNFIRSSIYNCSTTKQYLWISTLPLNFLLALAHKGKFHTIPCEHSWNYIEAYSSNSLTKRLVCSNCIFRE